VGWLEGQVSIITGGLRGLGRAIALKFADEGARVAVVAAHDLAALRQIEEEIAARGGDSIATLADVSRRGDVEGVVQAALTKWGRIDVLVNNAGILRLRALGKYFRKALRGDFGGAPEGNLPLHPSGDSYHETAAQRQNHQHCRAVGTARVVRRCRPHPLAREQISSAIRA
jgi:NAD(P)-dependent dehydrogenase (short-subunit alcohol dehydrogenase family)